MKVQAQLWHNQEYVTITTETTVPTQEGVSPRRLSVALTIEEADDFFAQFSKVMREAHAEEEYTEYLARVGRTHEQELAHMLDEIDAEVQ